MFENPTPSRALEMAIERAGGIAALARKVPVKSHSVIQQWRLARVPAEHCPRLEEITGVACEWLRPDIPWQVLRGPVPGVPALAGLASSVGRLEGAAPVLQEG
jgi:DNA-binding transcriptional regulator YdaS (Cro superfamily)